MFETRPLDRFLTMKIFQFRSTLEEMITQGKTVRYYIFRISRNSHAKFQFVLSQPSEED